MAVSTDELIEIGKMLSAPDVDMHVIAELRRRFPHLTWTRCDATDVTEAPFRAYSQYDLHLLDSSEHCAQLTTDPVRATGIVLAKRKPA